MAINKVEFGNQTLIDLTGDTATPEDVLEGKTFHTKSGNASVGTAGPYAGSDTNGGSATTAKKLFGQDTRSVNSPPSFYLTSGQNSTLVTEFKNRAVIDAPGSSNFGTLITVTPWMDSSGGLPVQTYVDNTGQKAIRFAQTSETWGSWSTLASNSDIPSVGNGTIKLQRNGVDIMTFTTNQNSNVTGNLIIPTKVSELTNDSEYISDNDPRLTDSRNAKDVYAWAKASTKPSYTASEVGAIATSAKGANGGVAELDSAGKVPSSQLPSFVDDVLEYNSLSNFPTTGEAGKIYIAKDTNKTYRWSGTAYVEISASLALGETSSTAYRGDRGKTAYDHSQVTSGNPHNVTKSDVGLGNVGNFKAVSTVASQGLTDTEKSNARANIGAGTSNLTIGTTSTTAAAGNHTHSTSIATSSGTNQISLAANTKYAITAGGTSYVFTTPKDTTYGVVSTSANGLAPKVTDTTKFLKGDGTWATPTDTNTHRPIQVNGTEVLGNNTTALNLKAGSNVTLTNSSGTVTIAATDTDTKNTAGSTDSSSKLFLIGATSQAASPQTYSHDTAYVGTDGCLYSGGTKVLTAHQDISGKYDKITQLGIKQCAGGGQYWYFKIATLTITQGYVNGPIAFELSQRQYEVTMIQVSFLNNSGTDPGLGYFITNQRNNYWIVKETTSTWGVYGKYSEQWGRCALHRIVGTAVNNGVTVTVNMENVSEIPSGATQVTYGGNCAFATSAGNASTVNNLTVQTAVPANAKFTDTTYTAGTGLKLSGTTFLTDVKRFNGGDLNYKPGLNRFELQEVSATTGNIPSSKWYHVLTSEGSDSNYEVQLALSMTNVPVAYYRQLNGNVYSEWYRLSKALLQKYETGTITNNTWYRLFAIKYTQYNYTHLRVLVKAGYLNFYEAFICVRYTPSGMNGNATSIKVISTYNEFTNADSKSLVLYKIDDNTIALAVKAYGGSSTLGFEILDITSEANSIKPESVIVDDSFTALSEEPTKFGVHSYLTGSYNDLANKPTITTYTFATGDSNGQIKVTPSGGTAQNVAVKGLGSAAYTASTAYATQTTLTNQNLNSLTVAGFYNAGGGNTVTNKPSGVDAFGLEVIHTAGGTYYTQLLYSNGDVIPYRRYCNNGTWTSWVKDESVKYTSSVNAVVGDTTCTISDSSITTTSLIEPFSSNSTGDTIAIKNIAVTAGQAVLTFKALAVDTSFRLRITNV